MTNVFDPFTRSTSFGLGTGYTWSSEDSTFANAAASTIYVNGSELVIPGVVGFAADSYIIDATLPTTGVVQFDILYPTLADYVGTADAWPAVQIIVNNGTSDFVVYLEEAYSGSAEVYFASGYRGGGDNSSPISITPDSWHTVKMQYKASGHVANYKIWQKGTPEPGWQLSSTHDTGDRSIGSGFAQSWVDFLYFGTVETRIDNLIVWDALGFGQIDLNATISSGGGAITNPGSFTADSWVRRPQSGSLTADSTIGRVTRSFVADGYVIDLGILRHDRYNDHKDVLSGTRVVLDEAIGPYPAGTTLYSVLDWLWKKVAR